MSLIAELRQAFYDLPLASKPGRNVVAHFCEHEGIRLMFTRARTTWHAVVPATIKPWWLVLDPLIRNDREKEHETGQLNDSCA